MNIAGQDFAVDLEYFMFPYPFSEIPDMQELEKLAALPQLTGASFADSNLDDAGLKALAKCPQLINLDLQGTQITDQGLACLAALPHLKYLRLKDNWQLTDACMPTLLAFPSLLEIQGQETSVTAAGLNALLSHLTLSHVVVSLHHDNYTQEALLAFSMQRPSCTVLVKGYGEFLAGKYEGRFF
jgi:hypothetical protein